MKYSIKDLEELINSQPNNWALTIINFLEEQMPNNAVLWYIDIMRSLINSADDILPYKRKLLSHLYELSNIVNGKIDMTIEDLSLKSKTIFNEVPARNKYSTFISHIYHFQALYKLGDIKRYKRDINFMSVGFIDKWPDSILIIKQAYDLRMGY